MVFKLPIDIKKKQILTKIKWVYNEESESEINIESVYWEFYPRVLLR